MDEHKEQQRLHFDHVTLPERLPLRETVMALHQVTYNRFVRALPLRDGDRVLELGFGWVQLVRVLAGNARFQGVGMDLSATMVAAAHRERGRMHFMVGDAESIPFGSGSFERLIALSLLEHLPHQQQALTEMNRVLKPGGHLLLQLPVRDDVLTWQFFFRSRHPESWVAIMKNLAHKPELVPHSRSLRQWLDRAGFDIEWERRDEVLFQPMYDYLVLPLLDRLKVWKDGKKTQAESTPARRFATPLPVEEGNPPATEPEKPWRPKPSGIHRYLLPVASLLLIPDYLLGRCGIGACVWILARKRESVTGPIGSTG